MKRRDKIKLNFIRNWELPGKERLSRWFKPSKQLRTELHEGITFLKFEDIAIYTNTDNYIEWTLLTSGTYEPEIAALINISVKDGDCALDVGANIGLNSIRMAKRAGAAGKVYACEPLKHLGEKFEKNVVLNSLSNIELLPFALSDQEGAIEVSVDPGAWNQGAFSLSNINKGTRKQTVDVNVGDNLSAMRHVASLTLIKIDVEGFEAKVLKGLLQTIKKHRPRIIFEYDSDYWAKANEAVDETFLLLGGLNYRVYQILTIGCVLIADVGKIENGNLFCIPA